MHRANEYSKAHEKMSLLGYNKDDLTKCTEILPAEIDLEDLADDNDVPPSAARIEAAVQRQRSIWL